MVHYTVNYFSGIEQKCLLCSIKMNFNDACFSWLAGSVPF